MDTRKEAESFCYATLSQRPRLDQNFRKLLQNSNKTNTGQHGSQINPISKNEIYLGRNLISGYVVE